MGTSQNSVHSMSIIVNQGISTVNRLRVVARGNQFQFYINGEQVQVCIPNNPDAQSTYFMDSCIDGQMLGYSH